MDEHDIRELIGDVERGRLSRRAFVGIMVSAGLTAPFARQLLAAGGVAHAAARSAEPPRRGGGGSVKILSWDGPTSLNPALAVGVKDWNASALFYEPLAYFGNDGAVVPVLAREIPSPQNGGVSKDGTVITWRLKPNVLWHDGRPFTADDVVFNWEYVADPATAAPSVGNFRDVKQVEALDAHTVRVTYNQPKPFWVLIGFILPKHLFAPYMGSKSREAPNNNKPIGTGPYRFVDFRPG
ncbi:MAG TPA: ABC transporter substrate-binding protein, partial [Gemmatimonadaceae bacterium]|nr:ABC transporter substrate-binding protein [Gemmatimonadaceae bacterium]